MFRHFLSGPEYVLPGDSFQEDIPVMRITRRYAYGRLRGTLCAELTEGGSPAPFPGFILEHEDPEIPDCTAQGEEAAPPGSETAPS